MRALDPRLLRHARAARLFLLACVGLGLLGAGLIVAQAALLAYAISSVFLGGADREDLTSALVGLAGVVLARAVVGWAQEVSAHRAAAAVKADLRGRLLRHLAHLGPAWLTGERTGELTVLATRGLDALDGYFARYLPQVVLAALIPLAVLGAVLPADLVAGATIVVTLPLIPVFMALVGRATQVYSGRQFGQLSRLAHHFLELVTGLPTLKAFGRAKAQVAVVRSLSTEQRRLTMRALRLAFLSSLVLELLATLAVALVAVGIGLRLVGGSLDLRTALLVLILAPEAYLPLRQLGTQFHASAEGLAAVEGVFTVLETPVPPAGTAPVPVAARGLALDAVTVAFPGRAGPALHEFSVTVEPGELVALTGPSGGGKSTVLQLLLGFRAPDSGRVRINGVDLAGIDPVAWRAEVAWLPQRPYLFAGTVSDNIALGRPGADPAEVVAAARLAQVDHLLAATIGDGGTGISAGERQRVALARVFVRNAPIVLLDEPTANLDGETEAAVVAVVRRLAASRTVVLVAHRPALLALADRVVDVPLRESTPDTARATGRDEPPGPADTPAGAEPPGPADTPAGAEYPGPAPDRTAVPT